MIARAPASLASLTATVREAVERAQRANRAHLAVYAAAAPDGDAIGRWSAAARRFGEAAYMHAPGGERELAAAGAARVLSAGSAEPIGELSARLRELRADTILGGDVPDGLPFVVGGFAFDAEGRRDAAWRSFPVGRLVLPRLLAFAEAGRTTVTVAVVAAPGADPAALAAAAEADLAWFGRAGGWEAAETAPQVIDSRLEPADWEAQVARAAADVRAGAFAKLVLARRATYRLDGRLDAAGALRRLRRDHPGSSVFAIATAGSTFLGASPERLAGLRAGTFLVDALAGSAPRGAPGTLLAGTKNRREHAIVVDAVRDALAGVVQSLDVPAEPRVRAVRDLDHLWTPIAGRVAADRSVLDLVARLHPTPAVAGWPRAQARAALRERERHDRGWYAGPVGWVAADGDGEFAVAIRSALLTPGSAVLYAGCGIMGDSDPGDEAAEAALKLRTMTAALGLD